MLSVSAFNLAKGCNTLLSACVLNVGLSGGSRFGPSLGVCILFVEHFDDLLTHPDSGLLFFDVSSSSVAQGGFPFAH